MPFDQSNDAHLKLAYELAESRANHFWNSETYKNACARYEMYRNAYYRKHDTANPVWKSKLYFPVFFMACKAFESAIKQTVQDPIANINYKTRAKTDLALEEKEKLQNYDIQHDMYISGFERTLFKMYWFNEVFGTSVGRETMVGERRVKKEKSVISDRFGGTRIIESSNIDISEHTDTDLIHPLNFAHALNRGEFYESPWGLVRYELDIADLYGLLEHPLANKEGIQKVIRKVESTEVEGWSSGPQTFYVDSNDYKSGNQDTLIATEYSGNLQYKGNRDDSALYWGVYSKQYHEWLLIGPSPYPRHPFWKQRCYPDPMGPYSVGPNSLLIPVNVIKNTMFNQYVDYTNANMKFLYQTFSPWIRGGWKTLIDGQPGGVVEGISELAMKNSGGNLLTPVQKNTGGIPGMADVFGAVEKLEVEANVASSRKKSVDGVTNTATGEMQIAEQQDAAVESIVRDMDHGLLDGIHQKVANRHSLVTEEQEAFLDKQPEGVSPHIRYFPFELGGSESDIEVNRKSPMQEANKNMAFLTKVGEGMQMIERSGGVLSPEGVTNLYDRIGREIGIEGIDEIIQRPSLPPQVNTAQPAAPVPPEGPELPPQPSPNGGAANGLALAI